MASSNTSEKEKLLRELQFYTSLVSNHVKHLKTSKPPPSIKRSVVVKPFEKYGQGNSSKSPRVSTLTRALPNKSVNKYQRSVIQSSNAKKSLNLTPSLQTRTSVIKPSLTNLNQKLPTVTSFKKINNNQSKVLQPSKPVDTKAAVSSRSVLLPQNTLKVNVNGTVSKPLANVSDKSKDLQKTLTDTKKAFLKIGAAKYIDELNKLTKQLEKRKIVSSLKGCDSLNNQVLVSNSNVLNSTKSSDLKSTAACNYLSKTDSLKCRVENIAKIIATTPDSLSERVPKKSSSSILYPTKSVNSSNLLSKKPCTVLQNKIVGSALLLSSSKVSQTNVFPTAKIVANTSLQTATPVKKETHLLNHNILKNMQAVNRETVKRESMLKRNSPCLTRSSFKPTIHKLVKSPKFSQTCLLTPLSKKGWSTKLNSSVKKQGIKAKIVSSKYKVINKNISSSAMSNPNEFLKHKLTSSSNPINTRFQSVNDAPCNVKKLSSKHKVVNIIKSPKLLNSSMLKTSTPRIGMQAKSALKKRRLSASNFTPGKKGQLNKSFSPKPVRQPKLITRHKVNNYLVKTTPRGMPKMFLNKNTLHLTKTNKFKVINSHSSSKRLSKSPKTKDVVRRTKSGVDMDLLLEIAAEKEQFEKENGTSTFKKRAVLLKRVYKTKNAIVNKNVSSSTGTKIAKMIKAKYSFNRRNSWQKQLVSKRYNTFAQKTGHHYKLNFQRAPVKHFYNARTKRNYFKPTSQLTKHKIRHQKGLLSFNRSYPKSFAQHNYLRNDVKGTPISKVLANRVLHRSINRVLTASVKKELKKSSKVNTYCMFYNRFGRCNKGLKCVYVHDPSKIAVCTRFLRGTCKNDKCLFSHEINPGKMAICSFFLLGSCTKTECPYRHETLSADAQLCKAFVQGYCPDGKQCKKAHVLVCPKYIQGSCDKGDACAFPHPPQKEKKNFPKAIEKTTTPVEAEDFMESVSRYFQPKSGQDKETSETTVVPKRQIIPEQPSFIAL